MKKINIPEPFEVLLTLNKYRYKIFYGGRGGAKSHNFARALLVNASKSKFRILCAREIQNSIKDSVHKLLSDIIIGHGLDYFQINKDSITCAVTGSEFIFRGLYRNIQEIKSLEGIDFCWVEEAQSVSTESLNILIPTIRKQNSEIWFSFNRFLEHDPIFDRLCRDPDSHTYVKKVSWRDNPFFTDTLREEMIRDKKRDEDEFLHIWEGEPLYQSEDSILERAIINDAMTRIVSDTGQIEGGVDVARFGSDRTVLVKRKGMCVIDLKIYSKLGIDEVVGKAEMFFEKPDLIKVDATGLGGGVCDYLRRDGFNAIDVTFNQEPKDKDRYNQAISEMWFEFKDMINEISIPQNSELFDELCNRKWRIDKKGRRCVESKDEYKKRGNKSPDIADALLLCFYNYVAYGQMSKQNNKTESREVKRARFSSERVAKRFKVSDY